MRTFKTGLSVFLVILIFKLLDWQGVQIAALTAVFSLREDFDKSLSFGVSRVLGNTIGGFFALLFYMINDFFADAFWVTLAFVPIMTMLTIIFNVAANNKAGIIGAVAAMLIITLGIPKHDTVLYVFARVFETFIGVFIAIIVNTDIERLRLWRKKHCE
ncbi:FUSC family protein [Streptococcus fryi]